mgnify:CR=1 FL=1
MFEAAELGQKVSRQAAARRAPGLRADLLAVQQGCARSRFP